MIQTEVTWNILTTSAASWNNPMTYLALSCESEFILTEVTWNIPTTTNAFETFESFVSVTNKNQICF